VTTTATGSPTSVAVGRRRGYDTGVWGIALVIATEFVLFGGLISSYFFLRATSPQWPPRGVSAPLLDWKPWLFTVLLLTSSAPLFHAEAALRQGRTRAVRIDLAVSWFLGAAFLVWTVTDFVALDFRWTDNAYASVYWCTVGLHAIHVAFGLVISATVQARAAAGRRLHTVLEVFCLYWHFVDVVWILVFTSLFLSPHL
jgi:heme/copper-type cytochrome/quinol oxidase subunit 3